MLLFICYLLCCMLMYSELISSSSSSSSSLDSIFLLGDSISEKIYTFGLRILLNCSIIDQHIILSVESSKIHPEHTGYLCSNNHYGIVRIGFSIHWGVATHPPYHSSWNTHRFPNSTIYSRSNIILSLNEFINRANSTRSHSRYHLTRQHFFHHIHHQSNHHSYELHHNSTATTVTEAATTSPATVYIIFLSNLWDGKRYEDFKHTYVTSDQFLTEYFYDYTTMVIRMMKIIKESTLKIQLVLSTMHKISSTCDKDFMNLVIQMNIRIKRISVFLELPVFDQYSLLGENTSTFLSDCIHQNDNQASLFLAQNMIDHRWNILNNTL